MLEATRHVASTASARGPRLPRRQRGLVEEGQDHSQHHERVLEPVIHPRDEHVRADGRRQPRRWRVDELGRRHQLNDSSHLIGRNSFTTARSSGSRRTRTPGPAHALPARTPSLRAVRLPRPRRSGRPHTTRLDGSTAHCSHATRNPRGCGLKALTLDVGGADMHRDAAGDPQSLGLASRRIVGEEANLDVAGSQPGKRFAQPTSADQGQITVRTRENPLPDGAPHPRRPAPSSPRPRTRTEGTRAAGQRPRSSRSRSRASGRRRASSTDRMDSRWPSPEHRRHQQFGRHRGSKGWLMIERAVNIEQHGRRQTSLAEDGGGEQSLQVNPVAGEGLGSPASPQGPHRSRQTISLARRFLNGASDPCTKMVLA